MGREIIFKEEAILGLKRGVDKLANAVKVTLGVKGRNVVISKPFGKFGVTKDGVTVAKEVELSDSLENTGAQMVKEVALKTNELAGDGTTTATVLAQAILSEGIKSISSGSDPLAIKRGIDLAVATVVENLEVQARLLDVNIEDVATISANNDSEIGKLIAEAFGAVGKDGLIAFEPSSGRETYMDVVQGIKLDKGYISPHFITDREKMISNLDNCHIFVFDEVLESMDSIAEVLQEISSRNESALIIAEDFSEEVLTVLTINKLRGSINISAIKTPGYGERKADILEDISIKTNSRVISKNIGSFFSGDAIGFAKKVIVGTDDTSIIGGTVNEELLNPTIDALRLKILKADSVDKSNFEKRIARLLGGTAILHIGAVSEVEMEEKKDRVEDAINATKSAVEEGIVAGGGVALLRAIKSLSSIPKSKVEDENIGVNIIRKSLSAPIRTILENAGVETSLIISKVLGGKNSFGYDAKTDSYVDMVKTGIIDPKKVTRVALENAASVAGMILTIGCVFVDKETVNQEPSSVN